MYTYVQYFNANIRTKMCKNKKKTIYIYTEYCKRSLSGTRAITVFTVSMMHVSKLRFQSDTHSLLKPSNTNENNNHTRENREHTVTVEQNVVDD